MGKIINFLCVVLCFCVIEIVAMPKGKCEKKKERRVCFLDESMRKQFITINLLLDAAKSLDRAKDCRRCEFDLMRSIIESFFGAKFVCLCCKPRMPAKKRLKILSSSRGDPRAKKIVELWNASEIEVRQYCKRLYSMHRSFDHYLKGFPQDIPPCNRIIKNESSPFFSLYWRLKEWIKVLWAYKTPALKKLTEIAKEGKEKDQVFEFNWQALTKF